jgi:VWFA-related protein
MTIARIAVWCLFALAAIGLAAQQQPVPAFRSGVDVVLLDVSVVDASGRPIGDLVPADFAVTVDGKPRPITSAQFLRYDVSTAARAGSGSPAASPLTSAPAPPRLVVLAIDEDSLEPGEGLLARREASRFLDQLAPTDRVGVVAIPRLRSQVVASTRRADARKALDAIITGVSRDPYEFHMGLAEAFDIERNFTDVLRKVTMRECAPGNAATTEAGPIPPALTSCAQRVKAQARQMELQARDRSQRSFDALAVLADALAGADGPKTLVLISGGMPMPARASAAAFDRLESAFAQAQVSLFTIFLERSSLFGQVQYRPSPSALDDDRLETEGIENATSAVGGTLMLGIGTLDQYFDRVVTELSGAYLLGVEVAPGDRDGRPHAVSVKVVRPGVSVRARKRYVVPRIIPAVTASAAKPGSRRAAAPAVTFEVVSPEAESTVARAGVYASAYEDQLSALVAQERYVQKSYKFEKITSTQTRTAGGSRTTTTEETGEWIANDARELESDVLLVKAHGSDRWLPFRDVYRVDGKQVRQREERLQKLFVDAPATAAERAAAITTESSRYNIGFVQRNVNLPTLALRLLDPSRRASMQFRKVRETKLGGVAAWELAFAERGSPTIVRDGSVDLPATGSFWVEPVEGRVLRSAIRFEVAGMVTEITVTYQRAAKGSGVLVPSEMRELYLTTSRKLECVATYSNIRRFEVVTDGIQKAPGLGPAKISPCSSLLLLRRAAPSC